MTVLILLILGWCFGAATMIVREQPEDAAEGALLLILGLLIWPFYWIGWIISRPWA
jgi:hypothetical protein